MRYVSGKEPYILPKESYNVRKKSPILPEKSPIFPDTEEMYRYRDVEKPSVRHFFFTNSFFGKKTLSPRKYLTPQEKSPIFPDTEEM